MPDCVKGDEKLHLEAGRLSALSLRDLRDQEERHLLKWLISESGCWSRACYERLLAEAWAVNALTVFRVGNDSFAAIDRALLKGQKSDLPETDVWRGR